MRRILRTILGVLTVVAVLHFVYATEMRGVPLDQIGSCAPSPPPV
jgi:hypothetical protein